jgi:RND family efflux transporter MFP subunit
VSALRWGAALAAAALVAGGGWWFVGRAPTVAVVAVTRGMAVEAVYATGVTEPVDWSRISPTVKGRLAEILVREGQAVTAGQVLARMEDPKARGDLHELQARERFLREEVRRLSILMQSQVASRQALDKATSELAQVEAAERAVQQRLADLNLAAPLDGVVLRRDGSVGEIVDTTAVLFWIGRRRPLWVVAEVDEEDIPRIAAGQAALVRNDAFPDRALAGTVSEITQKGDPVNKSYRVRIAVPDDTPLHIGMTTEVNIVIRRDPRALLVPSRALSGQAVWVVAGDEAVRRPVVAGAADQSRTEIREGLAEGDRVVAVPVAGWGERVRIRPAGGG